MTKRTEGRRKPGPAGNLDYVAHGSDEHAAILGLRRAENGDVPEYEGWTLVDVMTWGPNATDTFLMNMLKSKVGELKSPTPKYQSDDPLMPMYAPPIWQPGG